MNIFPWTKLSYTFGFLLLFNILLKHKKKIIMYCMKNVNINFSTFLNFVYKNVVIFSVIKCSLYMRL